MIYLCINSNMFHSIIFVSFILADLFIRFVKEIRKNNDKLMTVFLKLIQNNWFDIFTIIIWLISIIIESKGGRAKVASGTTLSNLPAFHTIRLFLDSVLQLNKIWIISSLCIIILGLFTYFLRAKKADAHDKKYIYDIIKCLFGAAITIIYLVILCARVAPSYIQNNTVMFSWMFWVVLIVFLSVAYLINRYKPVQAILPLLLYFLLFNIVIDGKKFADNNAAWNYGVSKEL